MGGKRFPVGEIVAIVGTIVVMAGVSLIWFTLRIEAEGDKAATFALMGWEFTLGIVAAVAAGVAGVVALAGIFTSGTLKRILGAVVLLCGVAALAVAVIQVIDAPDVDTMNDEVGRRSAPPSSRTTTRRIATMGRALHRGRDRRRPVDRARRDGVDRRRRRARRGSGRREGAVRRRAVCRRSGRRLRAGGYAPPADPLAGGYGRPAPVPAAGVQTGYAPPSAPSAAAPPMAAPVAFPAAPVPAATAATPRLRRRRAAPAEAQLGRGSGFGRS